MINFLHNSFTFLIVSCNVKSARVCTGLQFFPKSEAAVFQKAHHKNSLVISDSAVEPGFDFVIRIYSIA